MEWKRYLVLSAAAILVAKVFSCNLATYQTTMDKTCPPMAQTENLSQPEIDNFLELWPLYLQQGLHQEIPDKISLIPGDIAEQIPWKVNFWLNKHCWTAERFYYVEQRLRSIIRTLHLKQHTDAVKAVLTEQLKTETDDAKATTYQNMLDLQDKIYNIENISETELNLLLGREGTVEQILNGLNLKNVSE